MLTIFYQNGFVSERLEVTLVIWLLRAVQFMLLYHTSQLFLSFGQVLVHPMRILYFSLVLLDNLLLVAPPLRQVMIQTSVLVLLLSHISPNFYTLFSVLPVIVYLLLIHGPVLISSRSA